MPWAGQLALDYRADDNRTLAHDRHDGPLRVLRALYPEGEAICHHVLVHPPGGIVGGDTLDVRVSLQPRTHALLTTPGATRFYRSAGAQATQRVACQVSDGARLEWLPMETLVHDGARASNELSFDLQGHASMIGWDVLALGLPASGQSYASGWYDQRIDLPGIWLERGRLDFDDPAERVLSHRLLASPLGWAGHTVLATLWCATGQPWNAQQVQDLLDAARAEMAEALPQTAGATSPDPHVVVVRVLAARTEPALTLLRRIRLGWRQLLWSLDAVEPRVWRT